jgi:ParB/RepB/Spo0J family partition protein
MELELHQLELRYEALRKRSPAKEARLLASLAEVGQQVPVVVVPIAGDGGRNVLVDGYKRVRALRRLRRDTALAVVWSLGEAEALLLERLMRSAEGNGPLEEAWLLVELRDRFGMSAEELARRFGKSASWVSRRLSLVTELPPEIQAQVRRGEIVAHAAMKHLVPLARANREAAVRLAAALGSVRPTSRQVATLHAAWLGGSEATRARLLEDPGLFLRARGALSCCGDSAERGPAAVLLADLGALTGVARRALRHLREGLARRLAPPERDEVRQALAEAQAEARALFTRGEREVGDAGPDHALGDPAAA